MFFLGSVQSPARWMWFVFFWTRRTTSRRSSPSRGSSRGSSTCLPSRSSWGPGQSLDAPSGASASSLRRFWPPNFRPENISSWSSWSSWSSRSSRSSWSSRSSGSFNNYTPVQASPQLESASLWSLALLSTLLQLPSWQSNYQSINLTFITAKLTTLNKKNCTFGPVFWSWFAIA